MALRHRVIETTFGSPAAAASNGSGPSLSDVAAALEAECSKSDATIAAVEAECSDALRAIEFTASSVSDALNARVRVLRAAVTAHFESVKGDMLVRAVSGAENRARNASQAIREVRLALASVDESGGKGPAAAVTLAELLRRVYEERAATVEAAVQIRPPGARRALDVAVEDRSLPESSSTSRSLAHIEDVLLSIERLGSLCAGGTPSAPVSPGVVRDAPNVAPVIAVAAPAASTTSPSQETQAPRTTLAAAGTPPSSAVVPPSAPACAPPSQASISSASAAAASRGAADVTPHVSNSQPAAPLQPASTLDDRDATLRREVSAFEALVSAVSGAAKTAPQNFPLTLAFGAAFSAHATTATPGDPLWRSPVLRLCSEQGLDVVDNVLARSATPKPYFAEDLCSALQLLTAFTEAHASLCGAANASGAALIALVLAIRMTDYWSALQDPAPAPVAQRQQQQQHQQQLLWLERAREGTFLLLAAVSRGLKRICFAAADELPPPPAGFIPSVQSDPAIVSGPVLLLAAAAATGTQGPYLVSQLQAWVGHRLGKHRSTSLFWRNPSALVNRDTASILLHATLLVSIIPTRGPPPVLRAADSPTVPAPEAVEGAIALFVSAYTSLTPADTADIVVPPLTPGSVSRSIAGFYSAMRWTIAQRTVDACFTLCGTYAQLATAAYSAASASRVSPRMSQTSAPAVIGSAGISADLPLSPDARGRSVACREAVAAAVALTGAVVRESPSASAAARRCIGIAEAAGMHVASFISDAASADAASRSVNALLTSLDGGDPFGLAHAFAAALVQTLSSHVRPFDLPGAPRTTAAAEPTLARICEISSSLAPPILAAFEDLVFAVIDSNVALAAAVCPAFVRGTPMAPTLARRLVLWLLQQHSLSVATTSVIALPVSPSRAPAISLGTAGGLLSKFFSPGAIVSSRRDVDRQVDLEEEARALMTSYVSPLLVLLNKVADAAGRTTYSARPGDRAAVMASILGVLTLPLDPAATAYAACEGLPPSSPMSRSTSSPGFAPGAVPATSSRIAAQAAELDDGTTLPPMWWWSDSIALSLFRPTCEKLCSALQAKSPGQASLLIAELSHGLAAKEESVVAPTSSASPPQRNRNPAGSASIVSPSNPSPPTFSPSAMLRRGGLRVGSWILNALRPPVSFQQQRVVDDGESWLQTASERLLSPEAGAGAASGSNSGECEERRHALTYEPPTAPGGVADSSSTHESADDVSSSLPIVYDAIMSALSAALLASAVSSTASATEPLTAGGVLVSGVEDRVTAAAALLPELAVFLPLSAFPPPQSSFNFIGRARQPSGSSLLADAADSSTQPRLCYLSLCYAAGIAEAAFCVLDARAAAWTALAAAETTAPEVSAAAATIVSLPFGIEELAALRRAYNAAFQGGKKAQWQLTKLGALYVPSVAFERLDGAIAAVEGHMRLIASQTQGMGRMTPLTVLLSRQSPEDARALGTALAAWSFQLPAAHCVAAGEAASVSV
jgi:hypothetical protein